MNEPRYAIIMPACNEEACLRMVIDELRLNIDAGRFVIAVGVNGSSDRTTQIATELGLLVGITPTRGYGLGCQAAIDRVKEVHPTIDAYIFFAADGANDPRDIVKLVAAHEAGAEMVIGNRTTSPGNWPIIGFHVFANFLLGLWCSILTGRLFKDLGPLRLITRELFEKMRLKEWQYGWTIEAQVRAVMLRASIREVSVRERRRLAGSQKVSRVSWRHSLKIGTEIFRAGWRTRFRSGHAANTAVLPELNRPSSVPPEPAAH